VLGVRPVLGRAIDDADDGAVGSSPVAVISDGYWARRFGRSPSVIGKTIELNLTPITIIGVNPPEFTGAANVQSSPDIFAPFSMEPIAFQKSDSSLLTNTVNWWVVVMGRMKPGTNEGLARASLDSVLNQGVRATMTINKDERIPRLDWVDGSRGLNWAGRRFTKPVYVLWFLTGLVLLLACANLANLLLARASSRQREMGVRLALGASRGRIVRQMLTESSLISLMSGAVGLFLGYLGRDAIPKLLWSSWTTTKIKDHFDWQVFGYTAVISIATALFFGLAPALRSARTETSATLKDSAKDSAQTATYRRKGLTGKALVVLQISLSVVLVTGAGLFARTLINLGKVHLGFRPENILLFSIQQPRTRYPAPKDIALHYALEEKLSTIPGVDSVTLSVSPLIAGDRWVYTFQPVGQPSRDDKASEANFNRVGICFFTTMGIPVIAGRSFNASDTETSKKVAVVNQRLIRKFFSNENPIGKTFTNGGKEDTPIEIIGIVADTKYTDVREDFPPTYYVPYRQQKDLESGMTYEIRTNIKPAAITQLLRNAVQSVDKNLPLVDVRTQVEQIEDTTKQERIFASLTSGFGVLALILACIGIYGIMAYTVSQRTNEIGIRMALGAQPGHVLGNVLSEAWWLALIGVVAGLAIALGMGRLISSMLYGLKPYDPSTLVMAGLILIFVALAASWIPARRAANIDPMQALRHE